MARQLIIGCGYLGRRVAARWLAQGDEVAALTRSAAHAAELQGAGIEPIVGDVTAPATLSGLPDVDTLLYAVGFDRGSGHSQREVYVDGLRNVLERLNGRVRRVIYISSTSVYGQQEGEWIDEMSPTQPVTASGEVCLEAEGVVREFYPVESAGDSRGTVILRLAGIYGPGRLLRRIEAVRSATPVAGNPQAWLNLIHVEDAAAVVSACEATGTSRAVYLVADDRPVTREEYYRRLAELVNSPPPVFEKDTAGEQRVPGLGKRCRNARLREELGLRLQYPTIETGLPDAVGGG